LKPTFTQLEPLIRHFLHWPDTPTNMKDNIRMLIEQTGMTLELDQSGLLVFAFGPPTLIQGEERKQFNQRGGIRRMPEFLLYLILAGNSVGCRWSEVCAALWPDEKSDKASMLFHQHLKRLRKVVLNDSDLITLQQDYYRVDPARHEWCDALAFERLYEQAAKASPAQALDLWLELIALYRGEFLAGFELGDWGMRYRSLYEDQFLQAVELASEQLLQNGSAGEALVILKKGLAQDYFRESLHRSMLRAYAQLGLHDNLSTHYTELCHTFSEEFDAPPELETNQLYEVLMNHK
jgi:DNA-binding SARP family transcriptional activator